MGGTAPSDGRERKSAVGLECGNRAQQALRVGMTGGVKNIRLRAELDQAAGVHDRDAIGHMRDDGEIVGDEEHRQSEFVAKFVEQVEDLLLDGDIERGWSARRRSAVADGLTMAMAIMTRCRMPPRAGADNCGRAPRDRQWRRRACLRQLAAKLRISRRDGARVRLRRSARRHA